MAAFVNLAADPTAYEILEVRSVCTLVLEDTLETELVNVFHYHKASSTGNPSLGGFVNWFKSNVAGVFVPLLNVRVTANECYVRPLDDYLVAEVRATSGALAGAIAGDPLSAALAAVVAMNTGIRGRSFQGRKHFGGLSEADVDGGDELRGGAITAWAAVSTALALQGTDNVAATYNPCVLSTTLSRVGDTPPYFTGADVTSCALNHILGTMRRRKEKVPA